MNGARARCDAGRARDVVLVMVKSVRRMVGKEGKRIEWFFVVCDRNGVGITGADLEEVNRGFTLGHQITSTLNCGCSATRSGMMTY